MMTEEQAERIAKALESIADSMQVRVTPLHKIEYLTGVVEIDWKKAERDILCQVFGEA